MGALPFRGILRPVRERVLAERWIVPTPVGPVEYATHGKGTPLLLLHGSPGGGDQAIGWAAGLVVEGFRLIAPSGLGFLAPPLPPVAAPTSGPDTWATFLDAVGVRRPVPVVAFGTGCLPALQLALRHPDRTSALVLVVPGTTDAGHGRTGAPLRLPWEPFGRRDVPLWLLMRPPVRVAHGLVAVPASLLPTWPKHDRMVLEGEILGIGYPLERLTTPTLFVHAPDGPLGTVPEVPQAAGLVLSANLSDARSSGHLLLSRGHDIWPAVGTFIRHAAGAGG